ncbi:hypothetical protein QM306_40110, partial [Burkholderia cenocepacia]|nr:hypothetical protein [Burkholderia cenocepacia]
LIVPVFLFRHYWQDRGRFPAQMQRDMELEVPQRAMWLSLMPYAALIGAGRDCACRGALSSMQRRRRAVRR